jgi:hypothetical protein
MKSILNLKKEIKHAVCKGMENMKNIKPIFVDFCVINQSMKIFGAYCKTKFFFTQL